MKLKNVTTQLTKEIKRNPGKAAVLGGLLAVAIWFWYPLIQKWVGTSNNVATPEKVEPLVVPQPGALTTASPSVAASSGTAKSNWKEINEQIAADPWMEPGTLNSEGFDPFYPTPLATSVTSAPAEPDQPGQLDVSPEAAGLAVTSVIVGSKPIARINNQNYRLGDRVSGEGQVATFTLLQVHPWGVTLRGTTQNYELHLDQTSLQGRSKLVLRNGTLLPPEN
ncbi:hypothetical protein [Bremerella cremea]|uniref:hypothetical protein n=1 Tax=Bremerella cremea TaxID=1031537 RepID=UPI0031E6FBBA